MLRCLLKPGGRRRGSEGDDRNVNSIKDRQKEEESEEEWRILGINHEA